MNRSLPDVSRLTILDKYIITSMIYNCLIIVWHSVSHIYLTNGYPPAKEMDVGLALDNWFCGFFGAVFLLYNFVFLLKLLYAYEKRRNLYKREAKFIEKYKSVYINNEDRN